MKYGPNQKAVVLFDGVCNLCNHAIQFIIRNDPEEHFQFAALQSDYAETLKLPENLQSDSEGNFASVVLLEKGKIYTKSDAALRIAHRLRFPWPLFYFVIYLHIPKSLRDRVYDWIARNRYRWFGKQDSCMMPTPNLRRRFLS